MYMVSSVDAIIREVASNPFSATFRRAYKLFKAHMPNLADLAWADMADAYRQLESAKEEGDDIRIEKMQRRFDVLKEKYQSEAMLEPASTGLFSLKPESQKDLWGKVWEACLAGKNWQA